MFVRLQERETDNEKSLHTGIEMTTARFTMKKRAAFWPLQQKKERDYHLYIIF